MKLRGRLSAFLVFLVGIGLGAGIVVVGADLRSELSPVTDNPEVLTVNPESVAFTPAESARLSVTLTDPPVVVAAPFQTGTVTAVHVDPTDELADGSPVMSIDGFVVRTAQLRVPLHRSLGLRSEGEDVFAIQEYLNRIGLLGETPDGRFGTATLGAVQEYADTNGGNPKATAFDPAWLLYLSEPLTVGEVHVQVGHPAPPTGTAVVTGEPGVETAIVTTEDGGAPPLPVGPTVFVADQLTIAIDRDTWSAEGVTLDELSSVGIRSETDGPAANNNPIVVLGIAKLDSPLEGLSVPTAALQTEGTGRICVHVQIGQGVIESRDVSVVYGGPGQSLIASGLELSDLVVVNPRALGLPPCQG